MWRGRLHHVDRNNRATARLCLVASRAALLVRATIVPRSRITRFFVHFNCILSDRVNTLARHRQGVARSMQTRAERNTCCLRLLVGLYGGRCLGPSGPPIYGAFSFRFAATHSPPSRLRGGAVMHSPGSRHHERIRHLLLVRRCLARQQRHAHCPDLNSPLGILKRMNGCEGADGLPWTENEVSLAAA